MLVGAKEMYFHYTHGGKMGRDLAVLVFWWFLLFYQRCSVTLTSKSPSLRHKEGNRTFKSFRPIN